MWIRKNSKNTGSKWSWNLQWRQANKRWKRLAQWVGWWTAKMVVHNNEYVNSSNGESKYWIGIKIIMILIYWLQRLWIHENYSLRLVPPSCLLIAYSKSYIKAFKELHLWLLHKNTIARLEMCGHTLFLGVLVPVIFVVISGEGGKMRAESAQRPQSASPIASIFSGPSPTTVSHGRIRTISSGSSGLVISEGKGGGQYSQFHFKTPQAT